MKNFFKLSNAEFKGAFLLLILIVLIVLLPRVYYFFAEAEKVEDPQFQQWAQQMQQQDSIAHFERKNQYKKVNQKDFQLKLFDPNTVSYQELVAMGVKKKTAAIWLKFRKKGAKFYNKEDIKKIYGVNEKLYQTLAPYIQIASTKKDFSKSKNEQQKSYFQFDPNTVSEEELLRLDIHPKVVSRWLNFRSKGAKFYTKEDVLKIYGLSEKEYLRLQDYIIFSPKEKSQKQAIKPAIIQIININTADTATLKKIRGIGSVYAQRIVKYRQRLGGFYTTEQLKEVYGIKPELYQQIEDKIFVEKPILRHININTADFKALIKHPYINKELCIAILNLRKDIGGFKQTKDLISYAVINEIDFEKLKPYLKVE